MSDRGLKRKRCSYDASFKLKVVHAAEMTSRITAAGTRIPTPRPQGSRRRSGTHYSVHLTTRSPTSRDFKRTCFMNIPDTANSLYVFIDCEYVCI